MRLSKRFEDAASSLPPYTALARDTALQYSSMLARLRSLVRRRLRVNANPPTIEATAEGFVLRSDEGTVVHVEWASVRRVAAYKRDLYATDAIMLALELDPPGPAMLELSEEWVGFANLFGGMERALGVSTNWYLEIMVPAFEPTPRIIYERPNQGARIVDGLSSS